ncbi:hypothetical protein GCM10009527_084890 [Actinomadura nitritigenes]|uniref:Uncharacterized protein n=1 Tax=Actinomadura nitritigenes TaxID=134602 RepID=A0ABS3R1T7_9ACTN|nr:hypothetical protein [Actinomadura nitritigenes]MBO2439569.1 hypothetical protein [Actinomadura nitritigenes]
MRTIGVTVAAAGVISVVHHCTDGENIGPMTWAEGRQPLSRPGVGLAGPLATAAGAALSRDR